MGMSIPLETGGADADAAFMARVAALVCDAPPVFLVHGVRALISEIQA